MSQLFPTMTPDIMAQLIRAARRRRFQRRGAWRNAINNFRPATTAKSEDVSCVVSTSDAAARVERQGGATFGAHQDQGFNSQVKRRESSDGSLAAWCPVKSTINTSASASADSAVGARRLTPG